jgi:hypothetical protein
MAATSRVLLFAITNMIHLPDPVQNALMELLSACGFGYIVMMHIQLWKISPALAFMPAIAVIVTLHFLTVSGRANTRLDLAPSRVNAPLAFPPCP